MRKLEELALAENIVGQLQTLIEQLRQELENERRARVAAELLIAGLQERLKQALHEVDFWAGCTPHISGLNPRPESHVAKVQCAKHLTKVEGSQIDGDATGHVDGNLSDVTRQPVHCIPPSPRLQHSPRRGSALPTNWLDGQHGSQIGSQIGTPRDAGLNTTTPEEPDHWFATPWLEEEGDGSQIGTPRDAFATPWLEEEEDGRQIGTPRDSQIGTPRGSQIGTPRGSQFGTPRGSQIGTPRTPRGSRIATTQHYNSFYANQPLVLP
jgi:hypothetical protein